MDLSNPDSVSSLLNSLDYAKNCTGTLDWYKTHRLETYWNNTDTPRVRGDARSGPVGFRYGQYENNSINNEFLMTALPEQYHDEDSSNLIMHHMSKLWEDGYDDPRSLDVSLSINVSWYERALWQMSSTCLQSHLSTIRLHDLDPALDCDITATFLNRLNESLAFTQDSRSLRYLYPSNSLSEITFWKHLLLPHNEFIRNVSTLPRAPQNVSDFTNDAIHLWYSGLIQYGDVQSFIRQAFDQCRGSICRKAGFSGSPDVMGIGVFVANLFQTVIVSLIVMYCALVGPLPQCSECQRINTSRRGSTRSQGLLELSIFFFLAIAAARLKLEVAPDGSTTYEQYASSMTVIAVYFNVVTLGLQRTRPKGLRASLDAILKGGPGLYVALLLTMLVLFTTCVADLQGHDIKGSARRGRDRTCLNDELSFHPGPAGVFYAINSDYLVLLMMAYTPLLYLPLVNIPFIDRHSRTIRIISALLSLALLWTPMYFLINLRFAMQAMAGSIWQDADFGFGQTVALVTCIPMAIQFLRMLVQVYHRSNNGLLCSFHRKLAVEESTSQESAIETALEEEQSKDRRNEADSTTAKDTALNDTALNDKSSDAAIQSEQESRRLSSSATLVGPYTGPLPTLLEEDLASRQGV